MSQRGPGEGNQEEVNKLEEGRPAPLFKPEELVSVTQHDSP